MTEYMPEFVKFKKIARLSRDCVITEKIDGTNSQITITEDNEIFAGSRNRWLTLDNDNYGFAHWVDRNKEELLKLGVGTHFGEWWGNGLMRSYNKKEKIFSLFNVRRWSGNNVRPSCCSIVPVLYEGPFDTNKIDEVLRQLKEHGSYASPGFMNPEGIIIFHRASGHLYKKTILDDDKSKSRGR